MHFQESILLSISLYLHSLAMEGIPIITNHHHFVPSTDVVTSIVLPTILFCIGMVVAMLIGINKCKQWELDKIVEMRRTRRVIQRITARLREKNFRTIQSDNMAYTWSFSVLIFTFQGLGVLGRGLRQIRRAVKEYVGRRVLVAASWGIPP